MSDIIRTHTFDTYQESHDLIYSNISNDSHTLEITTGYLIKELGAYMLDRDIQVDGNVIHLINQVLD